MQRLYDGLITTYQKRLEEGQEWGMSTITLYVRDLTIKLSYFKKPGEKICWTLRFELKLPDEEERIANDQPIKASELIIGMIGITYYLEHKKNFDI